MIPENSPNNGILSMLSTIEKTIGAIDEDRLAFPELSSGEVPRIFSSLQYKKTEEGKMLAKHAPGSVLGAAALIAGTTVGAGVLALPTATAAAGFLPSTAAMVLAWVYMTMSGLLIAELTLNRMGETGRPGLGLLDLYHKSLGSSLGMLGSAAYFFLHYAMMVAYIAQGGSNLETFLNSVGGGMLSDIPGIGQAAFASVCGLALYTLEPSILEKVNNALVFGVVATFLGIVSIAAGNADFASLVDPANQHAEMVVNAFPILFLALVYQNVVPTVVTQLEGDRAKITTAIISGTLAPLLMFVAWNAVILASVAGFDLSQVDPVALLQTEGHGGPLLSTLVGSFSTLAVVTSLIGFTYGLVNAWTDVFKLPTEGPKFEKWKLALFAAVFLPPLALSVTDPDIFYNALDYGGAFGVSTLFLVLPPIMVWRERYGDNKAPLMTKPMVPLGKIPLGSMWKAAVTLIVEQGAEKLGVLDYLSEHFSR
jgi:tyrosine-specific transport protein